MSNESVWHEIVAERDKMISRSVGGTVRDDAKTTDRWLVSLRKCIDPEYSPRHMWIKVAAVALRAIEAIDRK